MSHLISRDLEASLLATQEWARGSSSLRATLFPSGRAAMMSFFLRSRL